MRGIELQSLLDRHWRTRRIFRGVFPCNRLPKYIEKGKAHAFIINTHEAHKPGEHWVALYISPFGRGTYFDSFGVPPMIPSIDGFIKKNTDSLIHNKTVLQSFTSKTCGLYCVYFINKMAHGATLIDVNRSFNPLSPSQNDRKIKHFVL